MSWAFGIAVYFVVWWVTLFAVLPFGVKGQHETGHVVKGSEPGAPVAPMLLRKVIINTIVAAIVFLFIDAGYIVYYLRQPLPFIHLP